jgi:nitroreductase
MDLHDLIKQRRSIRDFLSRPVERDKLNKCIEAARLAPSASNSQPWKFIVVDDEALKNKLCDSAFNGIYSFNSFCKKAPVIIVIVSEKSKFLTRIGAWFRGTKFYLIDIGIAGEHLVLQAEDLGLGTCWVGWFNENGVKSTLGVPLDKKVDILIALGYHNIPHNSLEHTRESIEKISSYNSF